MVFEEVGEVGFGFLSEAFDRAVSGEGTFGGIDSEQADGLEGSVFFTETEGISIEDGVDFDFTGLGEDFGGIGIVEVGVENGGIVEERNDDFGAVFGGIGEGESAFEGLGFAGV